MGLRCCTFKHLSKSQVTSEATRHWMRTESVGGRIALRAGAASASWRRCYAVYIDANYQEELQHVAGNLEAEMFTAVRKCQHEYQYCYHVIRGFVNILILIYQNSEVTQNTLTKVDV